MPFTFDIPTYAQNALPPDKRKPKWILFFQQVLSQITWRWGVFLGYRDGESFLLYNPATTYGAGDQVQLLFSTYESLIASNTGNSPDANPDKWILRNKCFIGVTERAKFNGGTIELTFELNRWFNKQLTAFGFTGYNSGQWPAPYDYGLGGGTWSSIYITNAIPSFSSLISRTAPFDFGVSRTAGTNLISRTIGFAGAVSSYEFVINIPLAVYDSLGSNDAIRESIVRSVADQYVASGLSYVINPY